MQSHLFHYQQFADLNHLCYLKKSKRLSVSVGIPTLNEELSIGKTVSVIKRGLLDHCRLVDEIVVFDSGSSDRTVAEAESNGATVCIANDIFPELKPVRGKGENMWKSIHVLSGDIIVWVDADIDNFHNGFITGLVGPLLQDDTLLYTTAYYRRPLQDSPEQFNGGRVTELLVRPFLSHLLPEVTEFRQPMAGEHAGRRSLLERLPFFSGYAVDVGHLIDISNIVGKHVIAQVDLDVRIHRNRDLADLSKQAFGVFKALMKRAQDLGRINLPRTYHEIMSQYGNLTESPPPSFEVVEIERPPMASISAYRGRVLESQ